MNILDFWVLGMCVRNDMDYRIRIILKDLCLSLVFVLIIVCIAYYDCCVIGFIPLDLNPFIKLICFIFFCVIGSIMKKIILLVEC